MNTFELMMSRYLVVTTHYRMHRKWPFIVSACLLFELYVGVDKKLISASAGFLHVTLETNPSFFGMTK